MSRSYTIHVRPKNGQRPADLVEDTSRILYQNFVANGAGDGSEVLTTAGVVDIYYQHAEFIDSSGIQFSHYPWYVEMSESRVEEARPAVVAQMWLIYHGLVDTGKYGCILVYGLGRQLAINDSEDTEVGKG
ncbi:MAG TPA: hypothetical protein VHX38_24165 [Pseudonocardiaceae bacterium]|jgi:hypothetical protein|nr:hypothetical protein [Pseudonocardiaceae bacterium]